MWVEQLGSIVIPDTGIEITRRHDRAMVPFTLHSPHRPDIHYSHLEFAKIDGRRFVSEINEILGAKNDARRIPRRG
jgi:hypothetical protein